MKLSLWGINEGEKRQLFKWRTEVTSFRDMKNKFAKAGNVDKFCSIYSYIKLLDPEKMPKKYAPEDTVIDKIFFDLDGSRLTKKEKLALKESMSEEEYRDFIKRYNRSSIIQAYFEMSLFHDYLRKKRVYHTILFSGGGFHLYVWIKQRKFLYPNNAIANYQIHVENEVFNKLTKTQKKDFVGIDSKIIGDHSRLGRKENTINPKWGRYSIPVRSDLIDKGIDSIINRSFKPIKEGIEIYGARLLDIKNFDKEIVLNRRSLTNKKIKEEYALNEELEAINTNNYVEELQIIYTILPDCLRLVFTPEPPHEVRYNFVHMLYDWGYTDEQTNEICRKMNWIDYNEQITEQQIKSIFRCVSAGRCEAHSCDKMKIFGYCFAGCNYYGK